MTMLPQQPAMFSWQQPLAALFGGLSAAGQPGGLANFGAGVNQTMQAQSQQAQQQQIAELRRMQIEQAQMEMNRANKEQADLEAAGSQVAALLGGGPSPVRPVGNYGAAVGGAPQPAMFNLTPEQSAILQARSKGDPRGTLDFLTQQAFAQPEAEKLTDDQREYQQGVEQGFQGTFLDWILGQRKAGATNVSVDVPGAPTIGTIPQGFAARQLPDGSWVMEVVPGGPAAIEEGEKAAKVADVQSSKKQTTDIVTEEINRVLQLGKEAMLPTTGGTGAALSYVPGTAAFNSRKLLDTIKSNIGFDRLQQMRDQSPTGGALGNVTKPEMDLLQAAKGSLEQSQDAEQFEYNLKRLYNLYLDTVHGPGNGGDRYDLGPAAPGPGGPQGSDLKSKYGLE
jgi:hypothetical protein